MTHKLDDLKKLRNRVHIEIKYDDDDTDWPMVERIFGNEN